MLGLINQSVQDVFFFTKDKVKLTVTFYYVNKNDN